MLIFTWPPSVFTYVFALALVASIVNIVRNILRNRPASKIADEETEEFRVRVHASFWTLLPIWISVNGFVYLRLTASTLRVRQGRYSGLLAGDIAVFTRDCSVCIVPRLDRAHPRPHILIEAKHGNGRVRIGVRPEADINAVLSRLVQAGARYVLPPPT